MAIAGLLRLPAGLPVHGPLAAALVIRMLRQLDDAAQRWDYEGWQQLRAASKSPARG